MQQHRELELLNSFRERFGCEWLQYRNHVEAYGSATPAASKADACNMPPPPPPPPRDSPDSEPLPSPLPPEEEAAGTELSPQEMSEEGRLGLEPREEEEREEQEEEEEAEEEEEEQVQKEVAGGYCKAVGGAGRSDAG